MASLRIGYWTRRLLRNVGIVALALVVYLIVVTATSHSSQVMFRLSMATGYTSVVLIGWALLIGPWRVRRGRSAPVSTDLRRDVGIWGGLFGLAHVATGLFVHLGDPLKYFVYRDTGRALPVRYDLFGFANWSGLAATLVLVLLLLISNDVSLRRLGSRRWKAWQRWTYWAARSSWRTAWRTSGSRRGTAGGSSCSSPSCSSWRRCSSMGDDDSWRDVMRE